MIIYVGNLSFSVKEDELQELFEEYGEVDSVKIIKDKFSGRSKGFGFVEMQDSGEANTAISNLNNVEFAGRNLKVNQAREKSDNNRRPFRPRN